MAQTEIIKELMSIPGVGKSIAADLCHIGITSVADLRGQDPEDLYHRSNQWAGAVQDRCLLYVFRCAVYFANTSPGQRNPELLKWWNWKEDNGPAPAGKGRAASGNRSV